MTPPLSLEEAQQRLLAEVAPLPAERVPIEQAIDRHLAEPLVAARTQPAADLSSMDGYAMRADDLAGSWRVVGESAAGHAFVGELMRGEAVRIATGALLPPGDCAVLVQEHAKCDGDSLRVVGPGGPTAHHIRRAGFDFRTGDELLAAGTWIGPTQLALAQAAGVPTLPVHRFPRIAVIESGDELVADPANCGQHQVPASNGVLLAAMAAPYSANVLRLGPVADSIDALLDALESADDARVIVTSGGASVGDRDLVLPALEKWGAKIAFWRVAIRPGKPLLVARRGSQWVLGLPGNPVSTYVTAFLFVLPLLRRLGGARLDSALPSSIKAKLGSPLPAGGDRREFLRATLERGTVVALQEQDSSALRSLAAANALIERAPKTPPTGAGQTVNVYLLKNGGIA